MTRKWMAGLLVAVALALLTSSGCGSRETPAPATGQEKSAPKPRIALIMKSLANEFFATMEKGARDHQAAHADRYELIAEGTKDESDVGAQVRLVEQMITMGVNAIVIAPADSKALAPACKRAADAGVIVVNIDNRFDEAVLASTGLEAPFVGPDNRKGARMVGEYLAKHLAPGSAVAIVEGVPTAFNAIQRKLGFEDAMAATQIKIVDSQSAGWELDKANRVVSAMVTEHPELAAILCANDSMALGAVAALRAAGKLSDVKVVGFDNISAVHDLVKNGEILATADQHAGDLAVFGIEFALEIIAKKGLPADRETPVDLVSAENI